MCFSFLFIRWRDRHDVWRWKAIHIWVQGWGVKRYHNGGVTPIPDDHRHSSHYISKHAMWPQTTGTYIHNYIEKKSEVEITVLYSTSVGTLILPIYSISIYCTALRIPFVHIGILSMSCLASAPLYCWITERLLYYGTVINLRTYFSLV